MGRQKQSGQIIIESLVMLSGLLFTFFLLMQLLTQFQTQMVNVELYGESNERMAQEN